MGFIKKYSLPSVVFITGACVLIIEVVATRILSPYYGNTIFTVSSVIGVVLAALSIGYYFGGKLADKYPSEKLFYTIILLSGFSVILLHIFNLILLPLTGYSISIIIGPIISAVILFFLPNVLLGTLSPFAIKIAKLHSPKKGIGTITGEIFFWSTLGSIFGSLSAGFLLIPKFGISTIILSIAIILIILGLFPLIKLGIKKKSVLTAFLFLGLGIALIAAASPLKNPNILYRDDGVYEKITIYNGKYDGKPARFFQQDRSSSGAMFLDSEELVYPYTKYYKIYRVFNPKIKNVLVIGGGAYSIPKALTRDIPNISVDVSEIEPSLFSLAKTYFKVGNTARIQNYVQDGRRFLHDTDKKYDLIFSDVYYSLFSIPSHFTTVEFFKIAKEKTSENGIFIANLIGDLSRQDNSLIMSEIKTFRTVFPNSYFFAVDSPYHIGPQNIIFVGFNSNKKIDLTEGELAKYNDPIVQSLGRKNIDLKRFELSSYPALTDNYSPVEYLTSALLQRSLRNPKVLNGEEMLSLINQQLRYGSRNPTSEGHKKVQDFLIAELSGLTPEVKTQTWQYTQSDGKVYELKNIIARLNPGQPKRIILGTHYDSFKTAFKNRVNKNQPMPGADNNASGVAVLVELVRILGNSDKLSKVGVDFVFFDGEEGEEDMGGDFSKWRPIGSIYFTDHIDEMYGMNKPVSAVVLDMVCDKDLGISKEASSVQKAPEQVTSFWNIARKIDSKAFADKIGQEISDDHTSLNKVGIPSFLVIDFDYPYYATSQDTIDKCSGASLEKVANAVLNYTSSVK